MQRNSFNLYLILFFLLFVLVGCYTLLSNPTKIEYMHKQNNYSVEKQDKIDEPNPMVNRYYGRRTYDPYVYGHNGYYGIVPRYHSGYNSSDHYHIHDAPQQPTPQTPPQQSIKVEVKNTPAAVDVKKSKKVWEKRVNPRVRQAPKPTRRQQNEKEE